MYRAAVYCSNNVFQITSVNLPLFLFFFFELIIVALIDRYVSGNDFLKVGKGK